MTPARRLHCCLCFTGQPLSTACSWRIVKRLKTIDGVCLLNTQKMQVLFLEANSLLCAHAHTHARTHIHTHSHTHTHHTHHTYSPDLSIALSLFFFFSFFPLAPVDMLFSCSYRIVSTSIVACSQVIAFES